MYFLLYIYIGMGYKYQMQLAEISSATTHTKQCQAKTVHYAMTNATRDCWRSSRIIDLCWTKLELLSFFQFSL